MSEYGWIKVAGNAGPYGGNVYINDLVVEIRPHETGESIERRVNEARDRSLGYRYLHGHTAVEVVPAPDVQVRKDGVWVNLRGVKVPPDTRTESDLLVRRAFVRAVGGRA